MARHKDTGWDLVEEGTPNKRGGKSYQNSTIQLALLMDLRDELKALNANLTTQNDLLRSIRRNTAWSRKKKEG